MMRHTFIIYIIALVTLAGCKENADDKARMMLMDARVSMAAGRYDAARDTIMSLRKRYPRALETRREAILVLDSVEYLAAIDSLTNTKDERAAEEYALRAEFYRKKLQHDAQAYQK